MTTPPLGTSWYAPATKTRTVRIALIDDHLLLRQGLGAIVAAQPDLAVVYEGSGNETVDAIIEKAPDVAIIDVSLKGGNGITTTRQLAARLPSCRVLILTMHASEDLAAHTFAAGAAGFALKSQDATAVLHAIRTVAQGSRYLAPALPARLLERPRDVGPPRGMGELSPREREVFNLIIQGQSNRAIAERLGISIKTVEAHRAGINRKLDAHSTADLVRVAARHGLLST